MPLKTILSAQTPAEQWPLRSPPQRRRPVTGDPGASVSFRMNAEKEQLRVYMRRGPGGPHDSRPGGRRYMPDTIIG